MAETTLFTFAEIEFLLRSSAGADGSRAAAGAAVRRRLHLQGEADTDIVTAAGVASLLARGLCTERDGNVVPGEVVLGAVAALSTLHTTTEAAGWVGGRPVVVHLFTGTAARLALYPGSFGLFSGEVIDPSEPLARPLLRFLDVCAGGEGETALAVRSSGVGAPEAGEVGLAAARDGAGQWVLSDSVENPDQGLPASFDDVTARVEALFGTPVGV